MAEGLSFTGFLKIRFNRLYPTIAAGVLVGAIALIAKGEPAVISLTLMGLLLIPNLSSKTSLFPVNGPVWSLFYEVFANIVHALALRRLSVRFLIAIAVVSYGLLLASSFLYGEMALGTIGDTFLGGFARVMSSYTTGVILFRLNLKPPTVPVWIVAGALPVIALIYVKSAWCGPLMLLSFPFILLAALGLQLTPLQERIAKWLGQLSYPLYAVHYPIIGMVMLLGLPRPVNVVLAVMVAIAAAYGLAQIVEPGSRRKLETLRSSTLRT